MTVGANNMFPIKSMPPIFAQNVEFFGEVLVVLHDVIGVKETYISMSLTKALHGPCKTVEGFLVRSSLAEVVLISWTLV